MMSVSEEEIAIFIGAVRNYFARITHEEAIVKGAYLADDQLPPTFDYTGLVTVSGHFRGCIYFSAPRIMLRRLLLAMKEEQHSDENLLDAVGEIANTLAGNTRKHFGERMEISVPVAVAGVPERIKATTRTRPYVIIINWSKYKASLVVDMEAVG